jgi:MSHA biogenesis protein MshL
MSRNSLLVVSGMVVAAGCSQPPPAPLDRPIATEMQQAATQLPQVPDASRVSEALLPPLKAEMPQAIKATEPRFDLSVNNAPATQVFMSIVSGTRYSMLLHSGVGGTISVSLKDVTVPEAMNALREQYGYEYKIDGTRIFVQPIAIQRGTPQ